MLETIYLFYFGFFTLLPALFFFVLFLLVVMAGLYFGLTQIITYRQVVEALSRIEATIQKYIHGFHFPDRWHLHH